MIRIALTWLRLLVVAFLLPAGALAIESTTLDAAVMQDACCSNCPDERSGECPIDCPSCDCHDGSVDAAIPESNRELLLMPIGGREIATASTGRAQVPGQAAVESLFRPPRPLRVT